MLDNLFNQKIDAYVILSPSNRFYCTKLKTSFGAVILSKDARIFITDSRYVPYCKSRLSGFELVETRPKDLYAVIDSALKKLGVLNVGYEDKFLTVAEFKDFKTALGGLNLTPASDALEKERVIKSAAEIELIKSAQKIAEDSLTEVINDLKPGKSEKEVAAELYYQMLSRGADDVSFETMVAFGTNSANPHYHSSLTRKLEKSDIILIDFGCVYGGYCSDMTRTFSISEKLENPILASVHSIVLSAQEYALKHIKAGMTGREADSLAREFIKMNGYGNEFSHSLGHGIGIDVHESPRAGDSSDDVLLPGMVISCEPGIYLDGIGGVRIEDMILITENGNENLTDFTKTLFIK